MLGATRPWATYDQLSLILFIKGFARNIIDETYNEIREHMLWYLNDLIEDATDTLWGSAKAVLICEMAKGTVSWSDTGEIDRIHNAHPQNHLHFGRPNSVTGDLETKKPWFCKLY